MRLVGLCPSQGVLAPEDPYTVRREWASRAYAPGAVCSDEWLLYPA
jgi:hypothetical protein